MATLWTFSANLRELWSVVSLFLGKFGRAAYEIAKSVVMEVATKLPEAALWDDAQRREYVRKIVTERLAARFGHVPGFAWVINIAIEFAVGWMRQQLKGARA